MSSCIHTATRIAGALILVGWVNSAAAATNWQAGVARLNITPTESMWMSGYGARTKPSEGKITDLWAKCLALDDGSGHRSVLVTMDLVGIDRTLSLQIRQGIATENQLSLAAILLSTSHTHTGPVVGENLRAMYFYDEAEQQRVTTYAAALRANIPKLARRALDDLQPARLAWGNGRATFAVNRRNNREDDVLRLKESGQLKGPFDHDVPVLAVRGTNEMLRAVLCGYACHATVLSTNQWSGDWPGFAQVALEEAHPGAVAMVWAGCGADQNPLPRRTVALAQKYGRELATAVDAVLAKSTNALTGDLVTDYREIDVPFDELPTMAELKQALASDDRYQTNRAQILMSRWQQAGGLSPTYPYPIQTWRIGNGPSVVALGGEVVVDYALRLKTELGSDRTWVMGYANDVMAYVPSRRVLEEGGYEGVEAMVYYGQPAAWGTNIEELIVQEVKRQLASTTPAIRVEPPIYPKHDDLTVFFDAQYRPQSVKTTNDWAERRRQIVRGMEEAMGPLPELASFPPLEVIVHEQKVNDDCERLRITYQAERGSRVPAYLLLPKVRQAKNPAMLCLHQTVAIGKGEPVGLGGKPNLRYAEELVRRGYICLVPDYPSFGELQPYPFDTDPYVSGTMKGIVNHIRGVDVLCAREEVDAARLGVIGHSLGGHNAMFVGVFEARLKVIVSSCGWTPFHDYYGGKLQGWTSDRYMPLLRTRYGLDPNRVPFDFYEVVAALAPRAFFSNSPLRDANFDVAGVKKAAAKAAQVFQLLSAPDELMMRYPDCDHDFPEEIRQEAYRFIDRVLKD